MSAFNRQPSVAAQVAARPGPAQFIPYAAIAVAMAAQDPFGIDDPCPGNPGGHQFIASCGDVVCPHCGKVVWR